MFRIQREERNGWILSCRCCECNCACTNLDDHIVPRETIACWAIMACTGLSLATFALSQCITAGALATKTAGVCSSAACGEAVAYTAPINGGICLTTSLVCCLWARPPYWVCETDPQMQRNTIEIDNGNYGAIDMELPIDSIENTVETSIGDSIEQAVANIRNCFTC